MSSAPSSTATIQKQSSTPRLLLVTRGQTRTVPLEHIPFTVGRGADRDLVIADPRVSRKHASFLLEDNVYFIEDEQSKHGTFVNGMRVTTRRRLTAGDRLEFGVRGDVYVMFEAAGEEANVAREFLSQISGIEVRSGGSADLEKLRLFLEAARKLNTTGVVEEVLLTLVDSTLRITGAERGYVFLREPDGKLRLCVGRNAQGEVLEDDSTISHSILEQAASAASEFLVSDTMKLSDFAARQSVVANTLRTVICIPLRRTQVQERPADATNSVEVRGMLYLDSRFASGDISSVSEDILRAIATEAAALIENAHLVQVEEANKRYQQELSIAASIQQRLMSVNIPEVPYATLRGKNQACKDVGGDFFDALLTDNGLNVIVTDISGKGISAALLASILQGMIYSQLLAGMPLSEIVTAVNKFLCSKELGSKYATLVITRVTANGDLEFVNCGHVPPVLVSSTGVRRLTESNVPVGLLPDATFEAARLKISSGDRLVLVTDGVTEAESPQDEFFGDERLELASNCDAPMDAVFNAVTDFCAGRPFSDDCTVVELVYRS